MNAPIAQVALDLPLDRNFDFLAPGLTPSDVGKLVIVPFGGRRLCGLVVAVAVEPPHCRVPPASVSGLKNREVKVAPDLVRVVQTLRC